MPSHVVIDGYFAAALAAEFHCVLMLIALTFALLLLPPHDDDDNDNDDNDDDSDTLDECEEVGLRIFSRNLSPHGLSGACSTQMGAAEGPARPESRSDLPTVWVPHLPPLDRQVGPHGAHRRVVPQPCGRQV